MNDGDSLLERLIVIIWVTVGCAAAYVLYLVISALQKYIGA